MKKIWDCMKTAFEMLLWTVCAFFLVLGVLTILPLQFFKSFPFITRLTENLNLITALKDRYPWLATVFVACFLYFLLTNRFHLNATKIKIFEGLEIELKQTESRVKAQVRNYLSSKRSIFVFYDDYDNYYDCINSMHKILEFLRTQLATFDNQKSESYEHIEGIIKELGRFLTKYQSNYRKYYELQQKQMENDPNQFRTFQQIQDSYPKAREMRVDFHTLNARMKKYADFFHIDIEKWKNWYQ